MTSARPDVRQRGHQPGLGPSRSTRIIQTKGPAVRSTISGFISPRKQSSKEAATRLARGPARRPPALLSRRNTAVSLFPPPREYPLSPAASGKQLLVEDRQPCTANKISPPRYMGTAAGLRHRPSTSPAATAEFRRGTSLILNQRSLPFPLTNLISEPAVRRRPRSFPASPDQQPVPFQGSPCGQSRALSPQNPAQRGPRA